VIENERQHRITKAHAERFRAALNELAKTPRPKRASWRTSKRNFRNTKA
jgi:hypothetical protein